MQDGNTSTFSKCWKRLEYLERWRELAVKPDVCDPDDDDMFRLPVDDLRVLTERCLHVRMLANNQLPIRPCSNEQFLVPRPSCIPNAGNGLFVQNGKSFSPGDVLCYYYGHIHTFLSARSLEDTSYLMLVHGNALVDPGPLPEIKARYINDPLNESLYNVQFRPDKGRFRSAVVATRVIAEGEELYVSYGDAYWSQQPTPGQVLYRRSNANQT